MASSKGQGVVYGLVVFVVLSIALLVTTIVMYQQSTKVKTALNDTSTKLRESENKNRTLVDNVLALGQKIGYPVDITLVGTPQNPAENTLFAQIQVDLQKYADESNMTYKDALQRLQTEIDRLNMVGTQLATDHDQLKSEFDTRTERDSAKMTEFQQAAQNAQQEVKNLQETSDRKEQEMLANLQDSDTMKNRAITEKQQVQRNLDDLQVRSQREIDTLTQELSNYKLAETRLSNVGTPVGSVVDVFYTSEQRNRHSALQQGYELSGAPGYVHVNLGSADGLKLQTTFSVWDANELVSAFWSAKNDQIAEQAEQASAELGSATTSHLQHGPKGMIEIVDILGPHTSLGRIAWNRMSRPIITGDQLHSPLFNPGRVMHVALVGRFDLTGRGTNDRELLKKIILGRGGKIDVEVDDQGRVSGEITPKTQWLVLGTGATLEVNDEEKEGGGENPERSQADTAIAAQATRLQAEARRLGVLTIDQSKFYDYMGFNPRSPVVDLKDYAGPPNPIKPLQSDYSNQPVRNPVRLSTN